MNVVINNLDLSIEVSQLHEVFSNFGEAFTRKIPLTNNKSNGYGFIKFINIEDAESSVNDLQGALIENKPIQVSFIPSDKNPFTPEFELFKTLKHEMIVVLHKIWKKI